MEAEVPAGSAGTPPAEEVSAVVAEEATGEEATAKAIAEEELAPPPTTEKEEAAAVEEETIAQSTSFKEESNRVSDLSEFEKKALEELKQLIRQALTDREFTGSPTKSEEKTSLPLPEEKPASEEKPLGTAPVSEPSPPAAYVETQKLETEIIPDNGIQTVEAIEETIISASLVPTVDSTASTEEAEPEPAVESKASAIEAEPTLESKPSAEEAAQPTVESKPSAEEAEPEPAVEPKASANEAEPSVESKASAEEAQPVVESKASTEEAGPAVESKASAAEVTGAPSPLGEVAIWGIPLLADERSDVILLKFLRARDFKVKDAFAMIKNTVRWRDDFGIEVLLEEDLGSDLEKVVFMHGSDREGHPVCYNVYGEFQNKELYQKTFSDEEKRQRFLRWRIQFLEKGIRRLDFSPTGINTLVQVTDLRNSPGPGKRELRQATNQALSLLQDNFPEFVAKQIFINVPWWYLVFYRMISPFMTQRTKSKFVFAAPSRSADTLFKYISPEQVPVQYGGLSLDNDQDFSTTDSITEVVIKPSSKHTVELAVSEACVLVWELRVLGWDISYGAEFVPAIEGGYTVIVQKARKMVPADEPVLKNSFKIGEPGKVVLTIDNTTSKKKKLLYRWKRDVATD